MGKPGRKTVIGLLTVALLLGWATLQFGRSLWGPNHWHLAEQALARRDLLQAGNHLEEHLRDHGDDAPAQLLAARVARRRGEYLEASDHLHEYQRLHGSPSLVELEAKLSAIQQGNLTEADALLAKCREHRDTAETAEILEALMVGSLRVLQPAAALGWTREGGPKAAEVTRARQVVALWLELRRGAADRAQGLYWRGLLHDITFDQPSSLADMREALEHDPDHIEARMHLATAIAHEAPAEAATHLEYLRRRDPANPSVRFSLSTVRRSLGQLTEARQLLDELLAADPDHFQFLVERGYVALNEGQIQEAEQWLGRALKLAPFEPEVYFAYSGWLHQTGRAAEGKTYNQHGLDLARKQKEETRIMLEKTMSAFR